MLVLARRVDEAIILYVDGRQIRVMVTEVSHIRWNGRHQVCLGFDADDDVLILREELERKEQR